MKLISYEINRPKEEQSQEYCEVKLITDTKEIILQGVSTIQFDNQGSKATPEIFVVLNMMVQHQVEIRIDVEEPRMFCLQVSILPIGRDTPKIVIDCHLIK